MLSREWFRADITESDNEDFFEEYFASEHIIQEFREAEYEGESLLIGKVLREIEESSNNNEKRAEIRSKKRQV